MESQAPMVTEREPPSNMAKYNAAARPPPISKQRARPAILTWLISSLALCFILASARVSMPYHASRATDAVHMLAKNAVSVAPGLLQDFQVYPPVLTPTSSGLEFTDGMTSQSAPGDVKTAGCVVEQTLMVYSFANSYGMPFVGKYTPPDCKFNRITFNLTVESAGRQYDRLAIVYFGSTELWRTSTAEPTPTGIRWVYIKDMSSYLALFKEPQTLIFDLGNSLSSIDTGIYNVTLTATFFSNQDTVDPADRIVPVSARNGSMDKPSVWTYPQMQAINTLALPRNIRKAVFTLSATGQIDEEFWFGNVPNSVVDTFGAGNLFGYSPFREVQLYIDGMLAGVAWPFPIVFTGGIVPGLWRPIVGIDAFDLKEDEIDITPFLPLLCDGKEHSFEIKVAGINDNGNGKGELDPNIGYFWLLTGKIFLWLDPKDSVTTGSVIQRNVKKPAIHISTKFTTQGKNNKTLDYSVDVRRTLSIISTVNTASGTSQAFWSQKLQYSNAGSFTHFGATQYLTQITNGSDAAQNYARRIGYPISTTITVAENPKTGAFSIAASIYRVQDIVISGLGVFPSGLQSFNSLRRARNAPAFQGSSLHTAQNGSALYLSNKANTVVNSSGTTQQDMVFSGFMLKGGSKPQTHRHGQKELYTRNVLAVNATVVQDQEVLEGTPYRSFSRPLSSVGDSSGAFVGGGLKRLVGHGPGKGEE